MSGLPTSLPIWIAAAIGLFWFVGAYNRIVRLRSVALQAYAALDVALTRQLDFVQGRAGAASHAAVQAPSTDSSLQAAADQLATLLAATRLHPLEPAGIAAMATALHVMVGEWQRLHPGSVISFDADGTLSRPQSLEHRPEEPGLVPIAWPEPSALAEIARSQFNLAVLQYNAAIMQFPAVLVAWIMQLRRAAPLR